VPRRCPPAWDAALSLSRHGPSAVLLRLFPRRSPGAPLPRILGLFCFGFWGSSPSVFGAPLPQSWGSPPSVFGAPLPQSWGSSLSLLGAPLPQSWGSSCSVFGAPLPWFWGSSRFWGSFPLVLGLFSFRFWGSSPLVSGLFSFRLWGSSPLVSGLPSLSLFPRSLHQTTAFTGKSTSTGSTSTSGTRGSSAPWPAAWIRFVEAPRPPRSRSPRLAGGGEGSEPRCRAARAGPRQRSPGQVLPRQGPFPSPQHQTSSEIVRTMLRMSEVTTSSSAPYTQPLSSNEVSARAVPRWPGPLRSRGSRSGRRSP